MPATASAIRTAQRVDRFTYAIRNIVAEAKKVEAAGKKVRYLNIGDPNQFGFLTPPHLIEAVDQGDARRPQRLRRRRRALPRRAKPPPRISSRAASTSSADRVLITSGTSEGIELALTGIVDEGEEVLVPSPTYPLYTAVLAKIGAQPAYLSHRSHQQLAAGSRSHPEPDQPEDARARRDRSEQSDRRDLSGGDTAGADRDRRNARPRDPRRRGLRRSVLRRRRCRRWRRSTTTRRSFPTRACRRRISRPAGAPDGWRWDRRRVSIRALAAIKKLADGRLCSPGPMQYAVTAALTGDRSHQVGIPQGAARARRADHRRA